jgi:protein ImuB
VPEARQLKVTGWAGPWLLGERWWTGDAAPGIRAHLQVTFDEGPAMLLACAQGGWTYEATYD